MVPGWSLQLVVQLGEDFLFYFDKHISCDKRILDCLIIFLWLFTINISDFHTCYSYKSLTNIVLDYLLNYIAIIYHWHGNWLKLTFRVDLMRNKVDPHGGYWNHSKRGETTFLEEDFHGDGFACCGIIKARVLVHRCRYFILSIGLNC